MWRHRARDRNGHDYYELLLVYVDDIMCVSTTPGNSIVVIGSLYDLKKAAKGPDMYLGATIGKW